MVLENCFTSLFRRYGVALLFVLVACPIYSQTGTVDVTFNNLGLSSMRYGGTEYLAWGDFRLNAISMRTPAGQITPGNTSPSSVQFDSSRRELTRTYPWGVVRVVYTPSGNRLTMAITTTNSTPNTITGLFLEPLAVRFPVKPAEYDGVTPILGHNIGEPTALRMTHGATALVLANDDVSRPLLTGFPFALDRPSPMLVYPLRVNTGRDSTYPDSLPFIDRPIAPGGSDTYRISLRFGPSSLSTTTLASDVYASFVALYPQRLNWPDRRPIGSLVLATAATGWPTNPRGWLLDPSIDVTTPAGVSAFRTRVLAWADNSVVILRNMNAQGMITWDIEGEQFPHPITYIGDPRQFATLAPEMSGVADEYFKKFRDAGLRVGVCIRPQQLTVAPGGGNATQTEVTNPAALLIDKIRYAKNRWGATLFYIDSNGDPSLPTSVNVLSQVRQAHPDVLLIPEHQNLAYFSISAPYDELRGGVAATAPAVREVYPSAFSVINTADGPIDARYNDLKAGVERGDSLMFRGWFDDPANAKVKSLYPLAPDASSPVVSFLVPGNNQGVSGAIQVSASASDDVGVVGVRFLVDNVFFGPELISPPYSTTLNTRTLSNGAHTLSVLARDASGKQSLAAITIQVNNRF